MGQVLHFIVDADINNLCRVLEVWNPGTSPEMQIEGRLERVAYLPKEGEKSVPQCVARLA